MSAPQEAVGDDPARLARARQQPLPAGVWLVRVDNRIAALYLEPGRARVRVEANGPWLDLPIASVWRNRLGNRVWITLPDGNRRDLYPFVPGERAEVEVGQPDRPYQQTRALFDKDGEGTASLIAMVLIVVLFPVWILVRLPRCTAAKALLAHVQWALPALQR